MIEKMRTIKGSLRKIGFSVRQFLTTFLMTAVIMFFMQSLLLYKQIEKIRDNQEMELSSSLEQANQFVDYYVNSIQELLLTSVMRDDLFYNDDEVTELLKEISKGKTGIQEVYTKQADGEIICGSQILYQILQDPTVEEYMNLSEKKPGMVFWSEPYYSVMQAGQTMCVAYTDGKTDKTIAAEVNLRTLYQAMNKLLRGNGQSFLLATQKEAVIIFDTSNQSVIPTVKGLYPLEVADGFIQPQDFEKAGHKLFQLSGSNNRYGMHSSKNSSGWYIFTIVNDDLMGREIEGLLGNFIFYLMLGLSMVGFTVYRVVFYFTKPIRQLAVTMEGVRDLETMKPIEHIRDDEVGRLTECYNRLMLRMQELVENVKIAERSRAVFEFRMYQNQIGPHFLKNVLYCIASLLRQKRIQDAEAAVKSLAELLSYSFDNSISVVELGQELSSLEKYLAIQKIRFGDMFSTEIQIKNGVDNCKIMKFILQPLVENAIIHGIPSVVEGQGRIGIRICRHKEYLVVFVWDNGCGMSRDQIRETLKHKKSDNRKDRFSGIGIANIAERIQLQYGEKYGIRIYSLIGKGTVIRVKLPYVDGKIAKCMGEKCDNG